MMIFKKCLPRRTFLRGLGATVALPLLDGMVPAFAAADSVAKPVRRLGAIYVPNGMNMEQWTPATEGAAFEFPRILAPLAPYRDRVLVLSGLSNKEADQLPGEGGGDHSRAQTAFLTGAHAKKTQSDPRAGISMDQIAAKVLGQQTQLASLELSLESNELVGGCELGLACAYSGTLAWRNEAMPLPMECNPRAVFERLFGASDSTDSRARLARIKKDRSLLDMVSGELAQLEKRLGSGDRIKLTEYVDAVRDVERRIQKAEEQSDQQLPEVAQPAGIPTTYEEYAKLMFDLLVLAYQCDLTRVSTFLVGREQSSRTFPEIGVPESWHPVSHHAYTQVLLEKEAKINTFQIELFAYFLDRMRRTPDGDGSLLDHTMMVYGSGISDSNQHDHHDLPILVAGGGAGQIKGGRHLRFMKDTPLANLHVTLLDKMGIPADRVGDSTGPLELLSNL